MNTLECLAMDLFFTLFKNEVITPDELNSAIENSGFIIQLICKGLSVSVGELRKDINDRYLRNQVGRARLALGLGLAIGALK